MSFSYVDSHFGLAPAEVVLFRFSMVDYTCNQMFTDRALLVDYSLSGVLFSLQDDRSLTIRRGLLLFVGQRHKDPRNETLSTFLELTLPSGRRQYRSHIY